MPSTAPSSPSAPPASAPPPVPAVLADGTPGAIVAQSLQKHYGQRAVVNDVSLHVGRGECVGLLGPNGAGKTTAFYMIMGLVRADGGRVMLGTSDITRWPMHQRARGGMGYLAQDASVFKKLSVEQNIMAILEMMPLNSAQRRQKCNELLEDLDLTARRHIKAISLSGGERRRTEIARAMATSPYFILLDEPFYGVDPLVRQEIQRIVRQLKARNIGVLITDHNEYDTLEIIDRGYILSEGRIITQGTARELIDDPQARAVYFGEKIGRHTSL